MLPCFEIFIGKRCPKQAGFSLIELLIVIAIVGLMASFAITGFKDMATSHGVGQALADVNSILELARNEAVTRQTYVWAAFRDASNSDGLEIQMALAGSIDGTTNTAGTNLTSISRVVRAKNVGLVPWSSLNSLTQDLLENTNTPADLSDNSTGITYTYNSQSKFTNTTITFTPRGEAMLKGAPLPSDGFTPLIGIGIVLARGGQKDSTGKNDGAVVLDGSTGMSRVLRQR